MTEVAGPDLKRLGIFKELSYINVNEPYIGRIQPCFRELKPLKDAKPFYLSGGYSKSRSATREGYFSEFKRIFEGDPYVPWGVQQAQLWGAPKGKFVGGKNWIPNSAGKKQIGVGSLFGNFTEVIPAFATVYHQQPTKETKRNFYTSPSKKGAGCGYPDVTINKFPEWQEGNTFQSTIGVMSKKIKAHHQAMMKGRPEFVSMRPPLNCFEENPWLTGDPLAPGGPPSCKFRSVYTRSKQVGPTFLPTNPGKKDGGMKYGTFTKWPEHSNDPYLDKFRVMRKLYQRGDAPKGRELKAWLYTSACSLKMPNSSILNKNIEKAITPVNRRQMTHAW
ncbi:unnamed protein product [Protopolystoma xenopodis]|uniref:Cilia-and flagella-associated protein 96 n=1 Tax=Protopolystoma xenopodis TaxID=117903 RepID=A0A3S4ZW06_9PLAT|nr:unnamed protein product [Protopolystoma xenopodis]